MGLDTTLAGAPRPTRRQWRAWTRREPVLECLTYEQLRSELDIATGTSRARSDALLGALWRLARCDPDAGGVLLACLLPALGSVAGRYRRTLGYEEAMSVAAAAVWDRVARFDPPTDSVAYRLRWLAGRAVHRAALRQRGEAGRRQPLAEDTPGTAAGLPVRVLLGEATDAGVVPGRGAWLVWVTYCEGLSLSEAAELLGVSYDAAKQRRQRAARRLRAWLDTSAARAETVRGPRHPDERLHGVRSEGGTYCAIQADDTQLRRSNDDTPALGRPASGEAA
jgi:hypothetical protein